MQNRALKKLNLAAIIVLLVIIIGALASIVYLVTRGPGERYTEFYLLGQEGQAADYPAALSAGEPAEVTVGIVNRERETVLYRMDIVHDGQILNEIVSISLDDNGRWERAVEFTIDKPGKQQKIDFLLYKNDQVEPCNSLFLRVDVTE